MGAWKKMFWLALFWAFVIMLFDYVFLPRDSTPGYIALTIQVLFICLAAYSGGRWHQIAEQEED